MPKFSIIIPVYNVEKFIQQCLQSVADQTFDDFEALVVDDCGTDNSIKIAQTFVDSDKRFKIIHHEKNRGLSAARNTALKHATGEYIVCLDSDDWLDENCLAIVYTHFLEQKTTSIWFNARKYHDDKGEFEPNPMYDFHEGELYVAPNSIAAFADFTWIKAYTRESIQKYNLEWPEGLTFEDGEFYFKYFTHNPKTFVTKTCLYNYRVRENSIVYNANRGNIKLQDIYQVVRNLKKFWVDLGVYDYRYKFTLVKLIENRVKMCRTFNYCEKNKRLAYEFIKDMNYPEDFLRFLPRQTPPLVTVVVPFYNVENYIKDCLDSICNQSYQNLEIICVDDCGQDDSISIVEDYAKKDCRIKIIRHEHNKGLGGARNTGLDNANGEFIFFIDSDDYIEYNCIELTVDKLLETQCNAVFFKADVFWENEKRRTPIWFKNYANFPEGRFYMEPDKFCSIPHYSWNKGYRRDFLVDNNIKWQEGVIYEDMEFFFKVFINSPETYMINRPLYVYRRRENSIISECYSTLKHSEDLYIITKRICDYLISNNLMDKYKKSFYQLVCNNLNNYRGWEQTHKKLVPLMLKCLDDINFLDLYKEEIV